MQRINIKFFLMSAVTVSVSMLFLSLSLFSSVAQAAESGGFGGKPAFPRADNPRTESIFVHTLNPGAIQNEGVLIVNNTLERKTIMVYAADSTPSSGGSFACEQFAEEKNDVGSWITLTKSEVTLESATNEMVPFTISVPLNASVGEHNGCILTQEKKEPVEGQTGAVLSVRAGLRVAITIPGAINRKLEIVGFTMEPASDGFSLHPLVKNTGNVSVDANALVATSYFFGLNYAKDGGQYPILRDSTSEWNFKLLKPFWGGWYRTSFTVTYDENSEATVGVNSGKSLTLLAGPSIWFFSAPAPLALAIEIGVLLLIIFFIFLFWKRHKRKKVIEKTWVEYEVKSGDEINALALRFGVSWKLLAKVNKLKPPYELKPGEKIKVPPQTAKSP